MKLIIALSPDDIQNDVNRSLAGPSSARRTHPKPNTGRSSATYCPSALPSLLHCHTRPNGMLRWSETILGSHRQPSLVVYPSPASSCVGSCRSFCVPLIGFRHGSGISGVCSPVLKKYESAFSFKIGQCPATADRETLSGGAARHCFRERVQISTHRQVAQGRRSFLGQLVHERRSTERGPLTLCIKGTLMKRATELLSERRKQF